MSLKVLCLAAATGIGFYYVHRRISLKKTKHTKLDSLLSLIETDPYCDVKDWDTLAQKLQTLAEKGKSKLQILADFDKTLTKAYVNGTKGASSFQVIENPSYTCPKLVIELKDLHSKYHPIEMSPTMTKEEKIPLMTEWYRSSFDIGVSYGVQAALIPNMVKDAMVVLRDGFEEFLFQIKRLDVPTLVVSAGLGDIIDETFHQNTTLPPQVSVLANYYDFNEQGVAQGLKGRDEMIHTFNKDKIYSLHRDYFDALEDRACALVMGDTLGDPHMVDEIKYLQCVLKVGFLNDNVEASLSKYLSVYDIVITGDTSMQIVSTLLHELYGR